METKNYHPNKKGFYKLKVSSKEIHKIFPKRKLNILNKFTLWYNPLGCKYMLIEDYKWWVIILHTLLLPFLCILSLIDIKDIWNDYKKSFRNRLETGNYCSDVIYPKLKRQSGWNSKYWKECYKLHNKKFTRYEGVINE